MGVKPRLNGTSSPKLCPLSTVPRSSYVFNYLNADVISEVPWRENGFLTEEVTMPEIAEFVSRRVTWKKGKSFAEQPSRQITLSPSAILLR
jgi:hypothetical protein